MTIDLRLERDRAMRLAYGHSRLGNKEMAEYFLSRANQFWPVTDAQIKYAEKLFKQSQGQGLVRIEAAAMNKF